MSNQDSIVRRLHTATTRVHRLLCVLCVSAVAVTAAAQPIGPDLGIESEATYQKFRDAVASTEYVRTSFLVAPKPRVIAATTALAQFATNNPLASVADLILFLNEIDARLRTYSADDPDLLRGPSLIAAIESTSRILDVPGLAAFDTTVGPQISTILGLNAPQYLVDADPTGGAREARALSFEIGSTRSLSYSSEWAFVLTASLMGRDLNGTPNEPLAGAIRLYLAAESYATSADSPLIDPQFSELYDRTESSLQQMPASFTAYNSLLNDINNGFVEASLTTEFNSAFLQLDQITAEIFNDLESASSISAARALRNSEDPGFVNGAINRRINRLRSIAEQRTRLSWAGQIMLQSQQNSTRDYAQLAIGNADLRLESAGTLSTAQTVLEVGSTAALLGIAVASKEPGDIVENATSLASLALGFAGEDSSFDSVEEQLFDEIRMVRQDIIELGTKMDRRFDDIETQLNTIYTSLNTGLFTLSDQLDGIQQDISLAILGLAENRAALDRIEGALWAFAQETLLGNLETQINLNLNFAQIMSYDRFLDSAALFEGFATGVTLAASTAYAGPNPPVMSGLGDFDDAQQAIGSDSYGSAINEIVAFSNALVPGVVPQSRLVSPSAWSKAAASFVQLCEEQPWHVKYSLDAPSGDGILSRINSVIAQGDRIKTAQTRGRSSELFNEILTRHAAACQELASQIDIVLSGPGGAYEGFFGIDPFTPSRQFQTTTIAPVDMTSPQGFGTINSSSWGDLFWNFWSPSQVYPDSRRDAAVMTSIMQYRAEQSNQPLVQRAEWNATLLNDPLRYRVDFTYTVSTGELSWSCTRTLDSVITRRFRVDCFPNVGCFSYLQEAYSSERLYNLLTSVAPGPFTDGTSVSGERFLPTSTDFGTEFLLEIGTDTSNPEPNTNTMTAEQLFQMTRRNMKNDTWNAILDDAALQAAQDRALDWHVILDAFTSFYLPSIYKEDQVIRSALRTSYFESQPFGFGGVGGSGQGFGILPDVVTYVESENIGPDFGTDIPPLVLYYTNNFSLQNMAIHARYAEYINATAGQSTHSYLDFVLEELKQLEANSMQLISSDQVLTQSDVVTVIPLSPATHPTPPPSGIPYLTANDINPRFQQPEIESFTQPDWGCIELDTNGNFLFSPPLVCDPDSMEGLVDSTTFTYTTKVAIDADDPDDGLDGFARSLPGTVTIVFQDIARPTFLAVPSQLAPTIASAIDRIVDSPDSVIELAPGTYYELINTMGKAFTLRSASGDPRDTIISGGDAGTVLTITSGEGPDTVIQGITFQDGLNLTAPFGGAVFIDGSSPRFESCWFRDSRGFRGGAVSAQDADVTFRNCLFTDNTTPNFGGAFRVTQSVIRLFGCTITNNFSGTELGRAYTSTGADSILVMSNTIISEDVEDPIHIIDGSGFAIRSNVNGGLPPEIQDNGGNIDADPMFNDPGSQDYGLRSGSPSVDAGGNGVVELVGVEFDIFGNPRFVDDPTTPDTGAGTAPIVDMGAIENPGCVADFAVPFGSLDIDDVLTFLAAFGNGESLADLAAPQGTLDIDDILTFLGAFTEGCP